MVTGEIKNTIDKIWDTFWTGGKYLICEQLKPIGIVIDRLYP